MPIEVKAGASGSLKSLLQYIHQRQVPLGLRFDLNPPSLFRFSHRLRQAKKPVTVEAGLMSLPLYMVGQLNRLLDLYRRQDIHT